MFFAYAFTKLLFWIIFRCNVVKTPSLQEPIYSMDGEEEKRCELLLKFDTF